MWRKVRLILLIGLVWSFPSTTSRAQTNPDEVDWYWASDGTRIIAFTLDGQANVILESKQSLLIHNVGGWRLAANRALLWNNATQQLILVGSDSALEITLGPGFEEYGIYETGYLYPFFVFNRSTLMTSPQAFVLNVENGTIQQLTGYTHFFSPPRFISGDTLRYFSWSEDNVSLRPLVGTLWERNLVTREETKLVEAEESFNRVYSTSDGEQWWIPNGDWDQDEVTTKAMPDFHEVRTFGPVNPLYTEWIREGRAHIEDNVVLKYDPQCSSECNIELYFLDGQSPLTANINLRGGTAPKFRISGRTSDGGVIIIGYDVQGIPLWAIRNEGVQWLGDSHFKYFYLSPGGRWLVMSHWDRDGTVGDFRLWDFERQELIYTSEVSSMLTTFNESVYFDVFAADDSIAVGFSSFNIGYSATADEFYHLEVNMNFEILPEAQYLVSNWNRITETYDIFRYDPVTETKDLIIAGYWGIGVTSI